MPDTVSAPGLLTSGERLYSPAGAAKASSIPGHRGGAHLNGSTIFRHITRGVRTAAGEVIRLEAVRVGGRWLTSLEAIARFSQKLTEVSLALDAEPSAPSPTPAARKRAAAAAHDELAELLGEKS